MKPNIILEIFKKIVRATYFDDQGNATVKHTTLGTIKDMLKENVYSSPVLPFWAVLYKHISSDISVIQCHKLGRLQYTYAGTNVDLHVPYLYFYHKISKNGESYKITDTHIYISFLPPNDNTKLFVPNINNVGDDGRPCWGRLRNDVIQVFNELSRINDISNMWFTATRNTDLVESRRMLEANDQTYTDERNFSRAGHIRYSSNSFHNKTLKEISELI